MSATDQEILLGKQRQLCGELRRLREQAGLSGRELAMRMGISQSKVSRIESGTAVPSVPEVTRWARETGAQGRAEEALRILAEGAYTEIRSWHDAMSEQGHLQNTIKELEDSTVLKLTYEPSVVPGLLQTAEYARRLFEMFQPPYDRRDIPGIVAARLERQIALFDPARRFEFLITEAALRFRPGSPDMMAAQLDRIASLSTLDNVSIGLIPTGVEALTHVPHGFNIFEPADGPQDALIRIETVHAILTVSGTGPVALYEEQWSLLRQSAVFGAAARDLVAEVASDVRELSAEGR
ncbi:MAG: helix-turn-helix transcriptional regulator [Streptosporangiaceae bacterium]